ncbi:O-antigen/teichoic acid export membrane protein [Aurantimicrobium minutum]|nr:O-antigen/teichoic acid export membrane protein [Aurantimicrobium minutum]
MRTIFMTQKNNIPFIRFVEIRILSLIVLAVFIFIWSITTSAGMLAVYIIVVFIKIIDLLADLLAAPLILMSKTKFLSIWSIFSNGIAAIIGIVLAAFGVSGIYVMLVFALVQLFAIPLMFFSKDLIQYSCLKNMRGNETEKTKISDWKKIISIGFPVGISSFLLTLVITFPQYVLAFQGLSTELPLLALILYLPATIDMIYGAVSQSWIPLSKTLRDGNQIYFSALSTAKKWSMNSSLILAIVVVITPPIATLIIENTFSFDFSISTALMITGLATPFIYFGSLGLFINQKFASNALMGLIAALISLILAVILIPVFGISGATWSIGGASIIRAYLPFYILRRKLLF